MRRVVLACALALYAYGCSQPGGGSPTPAPRPGGAASTATFPRLMGMNIGAKNYDDAAYQKDLARMDVVILGFTRGWLPPGYAATPTLAMQKVVKALKAQNPKLLVGQYTILSEASDDPQNMANQDLREKLDANQWWLRDSAGQKVQWTPEFGTWEVNLSMSTRPDANGKRWSEWLAERDHTVFFRDIPEFDIVFLDGVGAPRVTADWNLDGKDDDRSSEAILAAQYAGHIAEWRRWRALAPRLLLIGNADNDLSSSALQGQLDGTFLEAMMGQSWSLETVAGWSKMMERYRAVLRNVRGPGIAGFNAQGNPADYRFFRYAYASCLLADGYFSFTDTARGYSSVPWFDEYDFKLGSAVSEAPLVPWSQDVWRRDFQAGVVLVNPADSARTVKLEPGLFRLAGKQDPATNSGMAVGEVTLAPKDGIVLRRVASAEMPR